MEENEKNELREEIKTNLQTIEALNTLLTQAKQRRTDLDAAIELRTIEKVFWSMSFTQLVPKKPMSSLEKDFWFEFIDRYNELHTQLGLVPSNSRMERMVSFVYLAIENYDSAYHHFITHIKLQGRITTAYDLDYFSKHYYGSMKEIIDILQVCLVSEREGLRKDALTEAIGFLLERESSFAL